MPVMDNDAPIGEVPRPRTSFVGRAAEVRRAAGLLHVEEVPLLTITGPGGVGKTRLAIELVAAVGAAFVDGVVFVSLAAVRENALVLQTIARACGLGDAGAGADLETVVSRLRARHTLLMLDNFEHLTASAPVLSALLKACPGIQMIVTSRARLRIDGEHEFPVPPLALPEPARELDLETYGAVESIDLFVQRARAVNPSFTLTARNAADVGAICTQLDGLPLAIELAAVRTRVVSPNAVLALLTHRLRILTGGPVDHPERLRTMRSAIDWSYQLLDERTKELFRRLAVFVGGFDIDGATAVGTETEAGSRLQVSMEPRDAGEDQGSISPFALDGLEALIDHSLIRRYEGPTGIPRFTMLETLREFGLDELTARGELATVVRRHVDYCVHLAGRGVAHLTGPDQADWLARLDADLPNFRIALTRLRAERDVAAGLHLSSALGWYWRVRGLVGEGRSWLELFLNLPGATEAPPRFRAAALHWAGECAGLQGDFAVAESLLADSLTIYRDLDDKRGQAGVLGAVAISIIQRGESIRSIPYFLEAVDLHRAVGDHRRVAFYLCYAAIGLANDNAIERAHALRDDAETLALTLGGPKSFEVNFSYLVGGIVEMTEGRLSEARRFLDKSLALATSLSSSLIVSASHGVLGNVDYVRGDRKTALNHWRLGVKTGLDVGYLPGMGFNVQGFFRLAAFEGDFQRAALLAGVLDRLGRGYRVVLYGIALDDFDRQYARIEAALGAAAFAAIRQTGAALPLTQSLAPYLNEPAPSDRVNPKPETVASPLTDGYLTQRERQVLGQLVKRMTNAEIAAGLFIEVSTVETHVEHVLGKLGVSSRREAAALAVRDHLL